MIRAGGVAVAALAGVLFSFLIFFAAIGGEDALQGLQGVTCSPSGTAPGEPVAGFSGRQLAHAASIVEVGEQLGAPVEAQVIAMATAMQESQLFVRANNSVGESLGLPHDRLGGDLDSLGLFAQRASWGSVADRMDPWTSARLFYERLLAIPAWQSMPLTVAAQSVQRSAFPDAYAKWEQAANEVVGAVAGIACTHGPGEPGVLPLNPLAQPVIDRALSQLGVAYVWGGGNADGPTGGGFDCSGLMVFAFAGIGVHVPHQTQAIWARFQPPITDPVLVEPGDMVLLSDTGLPTGIHHVGLYLGGGRLVHAPRTGATVEVVDDVWGSAHWSSQFIGAVRALPTTDPRS